MRFFNKTISFQLTVQVLVLIFMTATGFSAFGSTITGFVKDASTGEGLPGANISIVGTSLGAATDLKGTYRILNVAPGSYTLKVSFIGYQEKEMEIQVQPRREAVANFELAFGEAIAGEEVVVTAQASGQLAAINRQLTSRQIINIVSSEKMQELPDANAAEALGRLPGISLKRSSGEANRIVVRGLSPKYNIVTLEGVRMASTNDYDRSVDLSNTQGEMLGGVEVSKTLRPDMDADAIGGTVNLRLKEADPRLEYGLRTEGGHADLNNSWNSYKVIGNVSDRFINNKLGIRLELSAENKNMPSHRFAGGYSGPIYVKQPDSVEAVNGKKWNVRTQNTTLTDHVQKRARYGGSLVLDYKSKFWNFKISNLYNRKQDNVRNRNNRFQFVSGGSPERLRSDVGEDEWVTDSRTHTWKNLFKLGGTELNIDLSTTFSKATRDGQQFNFVELGDPGINENWLIYRLPADVLKDWEMNIDQSYMRDFNRFNQELIDESFEYRADYHVPFTVGPNFSGNFSVGAKYRTLWRDSDGLDRFSSFEWGGSVARRSYLLGTFPWIETDINAQRGINARNFVDKDYDPGVFLDGRYDIGWSADIDLLTDMQNEYNNQGMTDKKYYKRGLQSYQRDYNMNEAVRAFYIMSEFNFGKKLMLLPGVRYERMDSEYTTFQVTTSSNIDGIEPNPPEVTTGRRNAYWFPSVNFKYNVLSNLFIQGAVYKSATRPSFRDLSPLVVYSTTSNNIRSSNPWLKPGIAKNYDLGFSVYSNKIGLFSVYGYYKEIDDLIFYMRDYFPKKYGLIINAPGDLSKRILGTDYYNPVYVLQQNGKVLSLPFNNTETAFFRGIELSWQTNFWYLPGLLKGLVLDVNYTFINSDTHYPYFETVVIGYDSSGFIPKQITGHQFETRKGSMQDQPRSILNVIIGWDYKGFSSRLSYRYQDRTLESFDTKLSIFDRYYNSFSLIDLMLRQKILNNLSVYANLTNIGNHIDDYFIDEYQGHPALPTRSEQYGFRAQFGMLFQL